MDFRVLRFIVKAWNKGFVWKWDSTLGYKPCAECSMCFFSLAKIKGFCICKKSTDGRYFTDNVAGSSSGMEAVRRYFFWSALYGGLLQGIGIGFVFLGGGTTGGTDLLAAIIQKYMKHYSIAQVMQFVDGAVVVAGMYVFGVERALYAIIAVYLVTKVSDGIIAGLKFSKAVYIITDKPDEVSRMVMEDIDRGITGIRAKGMYSGNDKLMLFCVVGKKELVHLKEMIDEIDPKAFVIVGDAREVHGEGFIEK